MWALQFVDRLFLLHYSGEEDVGLYGVAVRLSNLLLLVVTAFSLAWSPFALGLHQRDPNSERLARARVLTLLVLLLGFGAVGLTVYAHEILRIVTPPAYVPAYEVVGLLTAAVVLFGSSAVTMTEISLKRRTLYFTRYAFYAAVVNVALNFLLIPPWGIVGAGIATLAAYAILAVAYYWRAQRLEQAPFEPVRVLAIIAVAAVLMTVGTLVHLDRLWLSVLVKLPLVLAFPVLLTLLGVLERGWFGATRAWVRVFLRHGLAAGRGEPDAA
jgi:O-antigen/teichoic acid export membrane protein